MTNKHDLIIIGSGPAGLTAAIYSARYKVDCLVLSKEFGGTAAKAHMICNYPSIEKCTGIELMQKFETQARNLGVPIKYQSVTKVEKKDNKFEITTINNEKYIAKKVIYATGTERRKLGAKGEDEFLGKGVSYCATCDAPFFSDKTVAVIGGSDAALTTALMLTEYASKVYIIYRQEKFFRAEPSWVELVKKSEKIKPIFNAEIEEIVGDKFVEKVLLKDQREIELEGIFVEIGSVPSDVVLKELNIDMDKSKYIITDENKKTSIDGFYAAGDTIKSPLKQIVTAASDGAIAAHAIYQELTKENE